MSDPRLHEVDAAVLLDELERGTAPDRFATTTGGLVVVRVDDDECSPGPRAISAMMTAPFIVVVIGSETMHTWTQESENGWRSLADVVVADSSADDIAETYELCPRASVALALLLRSQERLDVGGGVVAESAVYSTLQSGPEFAAWRAAHPIRPRHPDDLKSRVAVSRDDGRLDVVLTRPHRRNALDMRMRDELSEALDVARWDPTITEVSIRGEGPNFCAGGDLDEFGMFDDPATAHLVRLQRHIGLSMVGLDARVTVQVQGACVGSGMEIAAFADHCVAASDTTFSLPEVGMGLVPGAGGTASVTARIGRHRTAWLALTRRSIDANAALEWGLVDEIVDYRGQESDA